MKKIKYNAKVIISSLVCSVVLLNNQACTSAPTISTEPISIESPSEEESIIIPSEEEIVPSEEISEETVSEESSYSEEELATANDYYLEHKEDFLDYNNKESLTEEDYTAAIEYNNNCYKLQKEIIDYINENYNNKKYFELAKELREYYFVTDYYAVKVDFTGITCCILEDNQVVSIIYYYAPGEANYNDDLVISINPSNDNQVEGYYSAAMASILDYSECYEWCKKYSLSESDLEKYQIPLYSKEPVIKKN